MAGKLFRQACEETDYNIPRSGQEIIQWTLLMIKKVTGCVSVSRLVGSQSSLAWGHEGEFCFCMLIPLRENQSVTSSDHRENWNTVFFWWRIAIKWKKLNGLRCMKVRSGARRKEVSPKLSFWFIQENGAEIHTHENDGVKRTESSAMTLNHIDLNIIKVDGTWEMM